jgi:hypothetical protein
VETEIGPVESIVLAFPGNRFKGEIVPALAELVENESIRIIDLAFVKKDAVGELLSADDLLRAAESLEPNNSAAVIVWENAWAARFAQAVRNADGFVLENERIPHEVGMAAVDFAATNSEG